MKTLLVIDDHPIVLEGIRSILTRKGFRVHKASGPLQASSLLHDFPDIDMIVADLALANGVDGLDCAPKVSANRSSSTPCTMNSGTYHAL